MDEVRSKITDQTAIVSVMWANNETGVLQPIAEIGKLARSRGILMHTDAAQSAGKVPVSVKDLNVDLLTLAGHKFYAPKGVGALYIRKGVEIAPFAIGDSVYILTAERNLYCLNLQNGLEKWPSGPAIGIRQLVSSSKELEKIRPEIESICARRERRTA